MFRDSSQLLRDQTMKDEPGAERQSIDSWKPSRRSDMHQECQPWLGRITFQSVDVCIRQVLEIMNIEGFVSLITERYKQNKNPYIS